jgi:hypothetical protein
LLLLVPVLILLLFPAVLAVGNAFEVELFLLLSAPILTACLVGAILAYRLQQSAAQEKLRSMERRLDELESKDSSAE